ncbi:hypothetical protein [Halopenitus persicus]|uniref:hypothetical protein n=1 Tax=Halopenitus persicus TaxID=1048396 RepID=UPI000BBB2042|nr:hypothetical protein [Halopenitus persicus]
MSSEASGQLNEYQQYELQKVAARGKNTTTLVALVYPPAAYYLVGKTGIAALCFFTAHFGLLAHIVAPFHVRRIITNSRRQVGGTYSSDGNPLLIVVGVLLSMGFLLVLLFGASIILGIGL